MTSLQMAQNSVRKARCYKELPVWVVEDHNDALPHIYRAIASRHLPFQGVTMLHFDSHPDLQIATELDADIVFDKFELFSSLSIENWILPAVYAGHIGHVVWIRPPWADQLPEGRRQVVVGKHRESQKLRISWPDSYFLSDLLYAPKDDLECSKELTVDVVTMGTDLPPTDCESSDLANPNHASATESKKVEHNCCKESCEMSSEGQLCGCKDESSSGACRCSSCGGMIRLLVPSSQRVSIQIKGRICENCGSEIQRCAHGDNMKKGHVTTSCGKARMCSDDGYQGSTSKDPGGIQDVALAAVDKGTATVLDIDLDFFSTRNPFKEIYPESQFRQLEDLYRFEGPVDDGESALMECTRKRAKQLKELEIALRLVIDGEKKSDKVSHERFNKVKSFVDALRASGSGDGEPLDAEMIHMAGLTCDDSGELPHHVSTEEEIKSLIVTMERLLSWLPKPVMVTVARSSHDDYCPPEQVDQIQQQVLQMLQNVYGKVDVHLNYKSEAESSETT